MLRFFSFPLLLLLVLVSTAWAADDSEADRALRRGISRSGRNDYEGALADFNKVMELKPDHADAYLQRGIVLRKQNKLSAALDDFNKANELDPKLDIWLERGFAYYNLGRFAEAIADETKYLELDPQDASRWNRRGESHDAAGNLLAALADYDKSISLNSKLAIAQFNRGAVNRKLGNVKAALEDFSRAIELNSNHSDAWNCRSLVKVWQGDYEGALVDINQAITVDPKVFALYANRYVNHLLLGHAEAAQKDYDEYLRLRPGSEQYLQNLAKSYFPILKQNPTPKTAQEFLTRGNAFYSATPTFFVLAAADYRRAAELDDFNPDAPYSLGCALNQLGYADAALAAFQKCLEADDRHFLAYESMGEIYRMKLNKFDEAVEAHSQALKIKSDHISALAGRGAAHLSRKDFRAAIKDFDKTLEMDPKYIFSLTYRGESHFKLGQLDKALADLGTRIK